MTKYKILITGGLGYIGGRVAQSLAKQPDFEIILGTRQHIAPPQWLPHSTVVKTLWNSPDNLKQICTGVNSVVHCAGMNAQDCSADPVAALEFNAVATAHLLRAAIQQGVKRFIYFSTAHVYGSPLTGVITEETCPINLHPYATSHLAGENNVLAAHNRSEIEGIVIRLSNAFGAPTHKDVNCWMLLVNDLCRQAVTTRRITLHTDGLQQRDFITLDDVSGAVAHVLGLAQTRDRGIFNLGGDRSLSVWDMALMIADRCQSVLGFLPEIKRPEPRPENITADLQYKIDKLLQTGFSLSGNFTSEIDMTLMFCKQVFGAVQ